MKSPIKEFAKWFLEAKRNKAIEDPSIMCLSTVNLQGQPEARMVLLKSFDERGFVFFTNLNSPKAKALAKNPYAALTFYWDLLKKQVRIQGKTELVSGQEADAYWVTRPRLSRLGAWASKQSEPLASRARLVADVMKLELKYKFGDIPRPPWWTGIRIIPQKMEFWIGGANRLHDRFLYTKTPRGWTVARLYP